MDIAAYKKRLQQKEQDLQADISRHEAEGATTLDPRYRVTWTRWFLPRTASGSFSRLIRTGRLCYRFREALAPIEQGTYGKRIDCGRRIESSRLEAIPWTPYCGNDQKRHEGFSGRTNEPTTL